MIGEYQPTRDPGGAWGQEQTRQMERDAAWIAYDHTHEATDAEVIARQQQRIQALEACLRDYERDFGCDDTTDESANCNSCQAKRLLGLPFPSAVEVTR